MHATPLLPVLAPPELRRKTASGPILDNFYRLIPSSVHMDIFNHSSQRLVFRRPLLTDTVPLDINEAWFEAWESVTVVQSVNRGGLYNPATWF